MCDNIYKLGHYFLIQETFLNDGTIDLQVSDIRTHHEWSDAIDMMGYNSLLMFLKINTYVDAHLDWWNQYKSA